MPVSLELKIIRIEKKINWIAKIWTFFFQDFVMVKRIRGLL